MIFRELNRNEIEKFSEIDRSEQVEYNYRIRDGRLELFEYKCNIKGFSETKLKTHKESLYFLFDRGGSVFGAFKNDRLVGLISIDNIFRGPKKDKLQLSLLHISKEYRGNGIGRKLVELVKTKAKEKGANKLYISCAPIKNTIDFYLRIGCHPTTELEDDLYRLEPDDIHMELKV